MTLTSLNLNWNWTEKASTPGQVVLFAV